jgi:hypothetical protein
VVSWPVELHQGVDRMPGPRLEAGGGVKPHRPKGRAVARGLDGAAGLQHAFMLVRHKPIKFTLIVITVSTATLLCRVCRMPGLARAAAGCWTTGTPDDGHEHGVTSVLNFT